MKRSFLLVFAVLSTSGLGCLNLTDAREGGARHFCNYYSRCGEIGAGQKYASFDECLVDERSNFQDYWPTSACDGKINGDALNVCYTAIDNTQCSNFIDQLATLTKCGSGSVCTASSGACNCGNGQTCCNGACVNLSADRNNCGTCGSTCGAGASCQAGSCR